MNFSTLQDLVDEEILMDWNMFVEQLPEFNQCVLNNTDLIEIDSVFNQLTEQLINEPNQLNNVSSIVINESEFNHEATVEPIQVDESLIGVRQQDLLDPDTSLLNQEIEFDALLDLSWFNPEEMILDYGELLIVDVFNLLI